MTAKVVMCVAAWAVFAAACEGFVARRRLANGRRRLEAWIGAGASIHEAASHVLGGARLAAAFAAAALLPAILRVVETGRAAGVEALLPPAVVFVAACVGRAVMVRRMTIDGRLAEVAPEEATTPFRAGDVVKTYDPDVKPRVFVDRRADGAPREGDG